MSAPSSSNSTSSDPASATRPSPTWWSKLHFSGRVIMCSIFLGFGLVLIGGVLFASDSDDAESTSLDNSGNGDVIPTKAPSNMVGTVVMGIGAFVTVVGVMMCLFETQVCSKKKRDERALIRDQARDVESTVQQPQRREKYKPGMPKEKTRSHHGKCGKGKNKKKKEKHPSPPSKSEAVPIESAGTALTSSSEVFLTPTDTLVQNQDSVFGSPLETGKLEPSCYYSSGQWSKSSEFQTPCASFNGSPSFMAGRTGIRAAAHDVEASERAFLEAKIRDINSVFIEENVANFGVEASEVQRTDDSENFPTPGALATMLEHKEEIRRPEFQTPSTPLKENCISFLKNEIDNSGNIDSPSAHQPIIYLKDSLESRPLGSSGLQDSIRAAVLCVEASEVRGTVDSENFPTPGALATMLEHKKEIRRPEFQTPSTPLKENCISLLENEIGNSSNIDTPSVHQPIIDLKDSLDSRPPDSGGLQDSFSKIQEQTGGMPDTQMPGGGLVKDNSSPLSGFDQTGDATSTPENQLSFYETNFVAQDTLFEDETQEMCAQRSEQTYHTSAMNENGSQH